MGFFFKSPFLILRSEGDFKNYAPLQPIPPPPAKTKIEKLIKEKQSQKKKNKPTLQHRPKSNKKNLVKI